MLLSSGCQWERKTRVRLLSPRKGVNRKDLKRCAVSQAAARAQPRSAPHERSVGFRLAGCGMAVRGGPGRMALPKQIVRGLFHWTARHPEIHIRVSSYYLARERVLIDPLLPSPGGLEWLERHGPPEYILLTNRLHSRHSARLVTAFGCTVWCHRSGLYDLEPELKACPFAAGDALPGGVRACEIGVLCPDESALLLPRVRAVAVADGVICDGHGPLSFGSGEVL